MLQMTAAKKLTALENFKSTIFQKGKILCASVYDDLSFIDLCWGKLNLGMYRKLFTDEEMAEKNNAVVRKYGILMNSLITCTDIDEKKKKFTEYRLAYNRELFQLKNLKIMQKNTLFSMARLCYTIGKYYMSKNNMTNSEFKKCQNNLDSNIYKKLDIFLKSTAIQEYLDRINWTPNENTVPESHIPIVSEIELPQIDLQIGVVDEPVLKNNPPPSPAAPISEHEVPKKRCQNFNSSHF